MQISEQGGSALAVAQMAANNWFKRITPGGLNFWGPPAYGNNIFVSISQTGTGNRVMTSPDGITWTIRTSPADFLWRKIIFANGLFVAVAQSGAQRVMTSPDGITWTLRTAPLLDWYWVAYGNGLFVACGLGGAIMTSPDAITWTQRTSPNTKNFIQVLAGNGRFLICSSGGDLLVSTDGISWTAYTMPDTRAWRFTYGKGFFLAVCNSDPNRCATSPDGITWNIRSVPAGFDSFAWADVTFGNGIFVASAGFSQRMIATSTDGSNWTVRNILEWDIFNISFGNGMFFAACSDGSTSGARISTSLMAVL